MVKKSNVGRKSLRSLGTEKMGKDHNTGFTMEQVKWIVKEAKGRNVHRTTIHREMADMYISSIESQRGDILTSDDIPDVKKDIVTQTKSK